MTKAAVERVSDFGPYQEVPSTQGLETPNGRFDGRTTNISFVFGDAGLRKIQIWAYEGRSVDDAADAWWRVREYLVRNYGAVETPWQADAAAFDQRAFTNAVRHMVSAQPTDGTVKLQMAPVVMPNGLSVFSSFVQHPAYGYYVFLYYQEP